MREQIYNYYLTSFNSKEMPKRFCRYPNAVLRPNKQKTDLIVCPCLEFVVSSAACAAFDAGADVAVVWEALYLSGQQPSYRYHVYSQQTHNIDWLVSKYGGAANISKPGRCGWFDSMITPIQVEHLFT